MAVWLKAALISIIPIFELRGGIPFAILEGEMDIYTSYLVCCGANMLAFPFVYFFLGFFHPIFLKMNWYENLFDRVVNRARKKTAKGIEKWGFWGLMLFVMIPLPVTGAYTGSLAAWTFGIPKRKAFPAVALGVLIAGVIVTIVVQSGSEVFHFLVKDVEL